MDPQQRFGPAPDKSAHSGLIDLLTLTRALTLTLSPSRIRVRTPVMCVDVSYHQIVTRCCPFLSFPNLHKDEGAGRKLCGSCVAEGWQGRYYHDDANQSPYYGLETHDTSHLPYFLSRLVFLAVLRTTHSKTKVGRGHGVRNDHGL
jgi:hypothetical protein